MSNTATKELIVLGCYRKHFFCKERGINGRFLIFKTSFEDGIPGSIITVNVFQEIRGRKYGEIFGSLISIRYCANDLGINVLPMDRVGNWSPEDESWGEDGEPVPDWFEEIARRGQRQNLCFTDSFTWASQLSTVEPMLDVWHRPLQVPYLSGDTGDFNEDPICEAGDLLESGNKTAAKNILMDVCSEDLRRLEAHNLLGSMAFDNNPAKALLHYQMGVSIGELSLENEDPDPALTWGHYENRPFLRCLYGAGLCAWRFGNFRKAKETFLRILSYNPGDNLGVRFLLPEIERGNIFSNGNEHYGSFF